MAMRQRLMFALVLIAGGALAASPPPLGSSMANHPVPPPHISTPPSVESIKSPLQIVEVRKLLDGIAGQVDGRVTAQMQGAVGGRNLTPEQEAILGRTRDNISALVKETISWEAMEAMSIRLYREALTQDELDGMLAFYKTPAGKAVIKKMPRLTQAISTEMQGMIQSMMPKVMAIEKQSEDEMKLATPIFDSNGVRPTVKSSSSTRDAPCTVPGLSPSPISK